MRMRLGLFLGLLAGLTACAGTVDRIALEDPRLPAEARRWIADAEDAMIVSRARLSAAQSRLQQVKRTQAATLSATFSGADGPAAQMARGAMASARLAEASRGVAMAEAKQALVGARLQLAYAEVAVRHDIKVYDLAPLQEKVDELTAQYSKARSSLMAAREATLQATDDWWQAWQSLIGSKSDTRPFWNSGGR